MNRAVHVAGRGAVSGFGSGLAALCDAVFANRSAMRPRRRTGWFEAPTTVAGEIPEELYRGASDEAGLPLWAALDAAQAALAEAGDPPRDDLALVLATTKGDMSGIDRPPPGDRPHDQPGLGSPQRLVRQIAEHLGIRTPALGLSCACASGLLAIAAAARRIRLGECERALVVATDALNRFIVAGFGGLGALDPGPCRPFDAARRGVSLGDGAGAMLLTAHASESIGVEVRGWAGANDAVHVTGPDYEGRGVALAARRALQFARLQTDDIDLVHLHGTGTRANDKSEAMGLGALLAGDDPTRRSPPAFGTKGHTGHTLGAAGVLESLLAIEALERGSVPPNHGLAEPDVDPRLDLVIDSPRPLARHRVALKVASGFGGVQGAVVFTA